MNTEQKRIAFESYINGLGRGINLTRRPDGEYGNDIVREVAWPTWLAANPSAQPQLSTGAELIRVERERQIQLEGFRNGHDDEYVNGELRDAAIAYAMVCDDRAGDGARGIWPWPEEWFKPGEPVDLIRCLTKAGALLAAEIDRLDREGGGCVGSFASPGEVTV